MMSIEEAGVKLKVSVESCRWRPSRWLPLSSSCERERVRKLRKGVRPIRLDSHRSTKPGMGISLSSCRCLVIRLSLSSDFEKMSGSEEWEAIRSADRWQESAVAWPLTVALGVSSGCHHGVRSSNRWYRSLADLKRCCSVSGSGWRFTPGKSGLVARQQNDLATRLSLLTLDQAVLVLPTNASFGIREHLRRPRTGSEPLRVRLLRAVQYHGAKEGHALVRGVVGRKRLQDLGGRGEDHGVLACRS